MHIEKTHHILGPDHKRVLLRSFEPSGEKQRTNIIARIMDLSEEEVVNEYEIVQREFGERHRNITKLFFKRFQQISKYLDNESRLSEVRQLLLGASFSMEYSVEAAALFNPSIVWHPDQSNLPHGSKRFIISLRATGEGHISSIAFRAGLLDAESNIRTEEPSNYVTSPEPAVNYQYDKFLFQKKISEAGFGGSLADHILSELRSTFYLYEIEQILDNTLKRSPYSDKKYKLAANEIISLTRSEYEFYYNSDIPLSERIIFPGIPDESNGIEDARFVEFRSELGEKLYYATYTAYNGFRIQSRLLETKDFLNFKMNKLFGSEVKNKGMALFPRKINGKYAMLSRQDGENNFIMFSDDLYFWNEKMILSKPAFSWETVQSGNCGSPIETDQGWLVLTHGVGPVRKYCIGAMLLDLEDPAKVIGRLSEPILSADENEREGYVPNVVYSCGSIIHNDKLIIPYAISDYGSTFAKVNLNDLLNKLKSR